jgi:hypothetical protein
MAKMKWAMAAARERVWRSGGGERLEPIVSLGDRHVHHWTAWTKPQFGQHWIRQCRK